jgi:hypothetical protein
MQPIQNLFTNLTIVSLEFSTYYTKLLKIIIATSIFPLTLIHNLSPVRAESPKAIGDITNLTVKIARNPLQAAPVEESDDDDSDTEASSAREASSAYIKAGYEAEQADQAELALANYYTAMKVDPTNGHAYLMAGHLQGFLGNTKAGIDCLEMSLKLFKAEGDSDCYKIAYELLQAAN